MVFWKSWVWPLLIQSQILGSFSKFFCVSFFYRPKIFGLTLGCSHNGSCIAENLRFYHYYYKSSQDSLTVTTCVHAPYVYGCLSLSLASGPFWIFFLLAVFVSTLICMYNGIGCRTTLTVNSSLSWASLTLPFEWFNWQRTCQIPCPSGKWEWKVTCMEKELACSGILDGTFL